MPRILRVPFVVAELAGQTKAATTVVRRLRPSSATDDYVAPFFDISQGSFPTGKLVKILVLHELGNVAVHVVNSPCVGQVRTDWRRTPARAVVGRWIGVMKVGPSS